ncbi:DsbE family thiol:disulfide interchange protein [Sansalvadorimonas sp. 2012CJ34-2]|uniref:DsbE family thiol:disulfide interchange protein n=1 Tax=Parendozoicomonas callyspongiae TaxID=2942213 RepID=A0ABT0PJV5_9GAMM|nr:DsbE family thiol:disulfide interchange protein [Sansalvadorimonas sp. 2012CJ34-2]MCL6271653.1 DsbE family thiol:disulfide interchange protein [Sansalvadorimonas sp. 2012CJ34-2]
MRRVLLLLPLILLLAMGVLFYRGLSLDDEVPSALVSRPFPAFELPSLTDPDRKLTQDMLKGEISLVNVWGTWCPTCYTEHGYLMELQNRGVVIFGMNYKDDTDKARQWIAELDNPYKEIFVDDGPMGIELGVRGAPETFLVDAQGVIRYKHEGDMNERIWQEKFVPLIEKIEIEQIRSGGQ